MQGISEKGIGDYFFIANVDIIPHFVKFALNSAQNSVGMGALVTARGLSHCIVEKFYGGFNVVQGALLGDLRADNVRSILAEIKVSPPSDVPTESHVLQCELKYLRDINGISQEFLITKKCPFFFTDDPTQVTSHLNNEVVMNLATQDIATLNAEIVQNMKKKKSVETITALEKLIAKLEIVVGIDDKEFNGEFGIQRTLKKTKKTLESFKKKGGKASQKEIKEVHHTGYTAAKSDTGYVSCYLPAEDDSDD